MNFWWQTCLYVPGSKTKTEMKRNTGHIGASAGLCDADAGDEVARERRLEEVLFDVLASKSWNNNRSYG